MISQRLSPHQRWLRYYTFVLGLILFVWLPFEDSNERIATAIAAAASLRLAAYLAINKSGLIQPKSITGHLLLGFLSGLLVAPLAFLLMAIKTGLHGHAAPDFTSAQVIAVYQRLPIWSLGGLLIGLGVGLWRKTMLLETQ